ncbi:unnamed protein product [Symbiodinium sp. CCMP2456]|nr:unnamed protein product [Symbiodinium sp. CCMP2456]
MGASCCCGREKLDQGDRLGRCFAEARETEREEAPAEAHQKQEEAEEVKSLQLVVRRTFLSFEVVDESEPTSKRRSLSEPPLRRALLDEPEEDCACKIWHPADNPFEPPPYVWAPSIPSKPESSVLQLQRAVHFLDGPVQWELYTPGAPGPGKAFGEVSWIHFA